MIRLMGKDIALLVKRAGKYAVVGLSTGCTLGVDARFVECAGMSANAVSYAPAGYEYTVDVARLMDGMVAHGDTVELVMSVNGVQISGTATVQSVGDDHAVGAYSHERVVLKGVGDLVRMPIVEDDDWDLRGAAMTIYDIVNLAGADVTGGEVINFNVE